MGFGGSGGSGGSIASSSDVALSGLSNADVLTYNTTVAKWQNKPASGGGAVSSVNGKIGAVTLAATDVSAVPLSSGGQAMRIVGYGTSLPTSGQAGDVFFLQGS